MNVNLGEVCLGLSFLAAAVVVPLCVTGYWIVDRVCSSFDYTWKEHGETEE